VPLETGLVVGKFAPFHNGHRFVVNTALEHCAEVIVLVYSEPDFARMPSHARARWIREVYSDDPRVCVFTPQGAPPNDADDFTHREFVRLWLEAHGLHVNTVFGSDDYILGFAAHIGAKAHVVDAPRAKYPMSGTMIRQTMEAITKNSSLTANGEEVRVDYNRDFLRDLFPAVPDEVFKGLHFWMHPVQTVVFLGAESTGKTTLAKRMALEYKTTCVLEYGREVWEHKGGQLEPEDYVHIARHHRELEVRAVVEVHERKRPWVFVDTNAITTAFLGYAYEGGVSVEVLELARTAETRYHHVFVCADDIPFEQDGWRDNAVWRSRAQHMIRYDLDVRGVPYTIVSGDLEARVAQVKRVLEGL
jgi:HTH-type transcriptional regulator, transcriptional repressor of NAD biosynthesis genes